jgi:RNA polymerase sigma-70 factor (ECF subfamily)
MEHLSDPELVQEVRNGNRRAYTELMRRYQQRVYWTARRIVGSHADAEDVTQESFVKAFLSLGDFRGDSSFFTWLYRITVNLSLNAIRKKQVMNYLRQSEIINRFLPSQDNPEDDLNYSETERRLHEAIALLPEKQKAVFVMRFFDELPYEDISHILNTSVGGLKANYFHALKKVQAYLRDEV